MYSLLRYVPKNYLSSLVGWSAGIPLGRIPFLKPLNLMLIRWFSRRYGANLAEASEPITKYDSLADFFVRDLKVGSRPIAQGVVSPVDGAISMHGPITNGELLQVKGKSYCLKAFLRNEELAEKFLDGYFITFYLAPGDYHQIHSPVAGRVAEALLVPGKLWPVNTWSVNTIDGLFACNERLLTVLSSTVGHVAVVKVGATNVGAIEVVYDDLQANAGLIKEGRVPIHRKYDHSIEVDRGGKLGKFCMGSTVVVLFEPGRFNPGDGCKQGAIRLGTRLDK